MYLCVMGYLYQVRTVRYDVFVLGVSSQGSEMSCIVLLGVSVPCQDSEMFVYLCDRVIKSEQ